LLQKRRQSAKINFDDFATTFKRANYLAATGLFFQSIAVFAEIAGDYPLEFLPHVGYSVVLEKAGLYKRAVDELEIGISLMENSPKHETAKIAFNQRLSDLKQKAIAPSQAPSGFLNKLNKYNPQTMLYAGGMFSSDYISFDSRFGIYLSDSFNGAINLGISGNSDAVSTNLGISAYERLGNVFLVGFGVNQQLGKGSNLFSINPSVGLTHFAAPPLQKTVFSTNF
jgi:hypothetical protein